MTELVPFDPTVGITVVASVTLVLMTAVMVFLAVAPIISSNWAENLSAPTELHSGAVDSSKAD